MANDTHHRSVSDLAGCGHCTAHPVRAQESNLKHTSYIECLYAMHSLYLAHVSMCTSRFRSPGTAHRRWHPLDCQAMPHRPWRCHPHTFAEHKAGLPAQELPDLIVKMHNYIKLH